MSSVSVVAWGHGDGYLQLETQEWINSRGEFAQDLTDDLRDWMDAGGHDRPHDEVIAAWVEDRTGEPPAGLHGDGLVWNHSLFNFSDHLLTDDLGFVVLSSGDWGDLMVVVSDQQARYVSPEVYRSTVVELEDWADYSSAIGECVNGHRWQTDDTVQLRDLDGRDRSIYRVLDRIRVPFGDRERGYVACPRCRRAVRFENGF